MNIVGELIFAAPALALLVLAMFFLAEVIGAFFSREPALAEAPLGPVAIIIPAHNEGAGIVATIEDAKAQMRPGDRLIVIADNCTDDTAAIARAAGAEALERRDADRRGKGYALQFALDALKRDPGAAPAAVFFVDADCRLAPGAVTRTVAAALGAGRPAQALYLMNAPSMQPTPKQRVAAFAWAVINKVRMAGLYAMCDVTRLTGAGMALPWRIAADLQLASGEIVEDLALTLKLVEDGTPPVFVRAALVTSEFPSTEEAAAVQRARWEHGSMRIARARTGDLLRRGVLNGDIRAVAMGLDLAIPPLTVFAALLIAALAGGGALLLFGFTAAFAAAAAAAAAFALAAGLAWAGFCREILPLRTAGAVVAYALGKRQVYAGKARESTKTWTRTAREAEADRKDNRDGE